MWKQEFKDYNSDIKDIYLAILLTAYYNDVVCLTNSEDGNVKQEDFIDEFINSYFGYYYAYEDNHTEFNEEGCDPDIVELSISGIDNSNSITITTTNHDKLLQVFDSYFKHYESNDIMSEDNILTLEAHRKRLYEYLTEQECNLIYFHVKDVSYIKSICYAYYEDLIFIHDMKLELDDKYNIVSFDCYGDFSRFVEDYKNPKAILVQAPATTKTTKRRTHYSPSVKELYDYIKTYAPAKNFEIYKNDLIGENRKTKLYAGMGTLTTMVNRLNKEYREISNTDITLMKYDKFLDCYLITNIWEE